MPSAGSQVAGSGQGEHDLLVRDYCSRVATDFIIGHSSEEQYAAGCMVLDYLMKDVGSGRERFVSTDKLRQHLEEAYGIAVSEHQFRTKVVAPLRDQGVVLASGSSGYKIPSTIADLRSYVELTKSQVVPMVARLSHAREQLLTVSGKQLDILSDDEEVLRAILRAMCPLGVPSNGAESNARKERGSG